MERDAVLASLYGEQEKYGRLVEQIMAFQSQCNAGDTHGVVSKKIGTAYLLGCDPEMIIEKECELQDELIQLYEQLETQLEINVQLRRQILHIQRIKECYTCNTSVDVSSTNTITDTIAVLKRKQEEYQMVIDKNKEHSNDIQLLSEIVSLITRHEQLSKELSEFHDLPGDLSEALTEIARLEAELHYE